MGGAFGVELGGQHGQGVRVRRPRPAGRHTVRQRLRQTRDLGGHAIQLAAQRAPGDDLGLQARAGQRRRLGCVARPRAGGRSELLGPGHAAGRLVAHEAHVRRLLGDAAAVSSRAAAATAAARPSSRSRAAR